MGYSLLQIPDFIQLVSEKFKKYLAEGKASSEKTIEHTTKIFVREQLPEHAENRPNTENLILEILRRMQSDLEHQCQRINELENFTFILNEKETCKRNK